MFIADKMNFYLPSSIEVLLSPAMGYLCTLSVTPFPPIIGALYCFSDQLLYEAAPFLRHKEGDTRFLYVALEITRIASALGITIVASQGLGISIGLKGFLTVAAVSMALPMAIPMAIPVAKLLLEELGKVLIISRRIFSNMMSLN